MIKSETRILKTYATYDNPNRQLSTTKEKSLIVDHTCVASSDLQVYNVHFVPDFLQLLDLSLHGVHTQSVC